MPKPTQAHLERTINKNDPLKDRQQTLSQMQYYMGAKLIEVRVDPQAVMYRWSIENQGEKQICTLSAFWGDSKAKILSGEHPLQGEELINCARANVSKGLSQTTELCGFATDTSGFQTALKDAIALLEISTKPFEKLLV